MGNNEQGSQSSLLGTLLALPKTPPRSWTVASPRAPYASHRHRSQHQHPYTRTTRTP
ncbi:hypothetical protein CKAH01_10855 [Colletotrichum kahawae]|uniref:Uncharacterized protein n=1 Tax=Colletotrichum kahawae TaxID=34407 RepID=A0AAE0CWZ9_COLKA|nr:hypothetical protein CKAH01_10855 [Colletotrichum kahawae]